MRNIHFIFLLFVLAVFFGWVSPNLFADGMFLDGVVYAAISKNMAHGIGSFWSPHLSDGLFPVFYEHPPLGLGLQSIWFSFFGDSILVERFYSLATFIATGMFIAVIWKETTKNLRTAWIPLLFWVTTPLVTWACVNNILENTMSVFVCLSAWLYLKSLKNNSLLMVAMSGLALTLAFLTKGPASLYIWALPFFYWLIYRNVSFWKMFLHSVLLMTTTILPLALLYLLCEAAKDNLTLYFSKQVIGSIQQEGTVNSRFAILGEFLQSILVPVLIGLLMAGLAYMKKIPLRLTCTHAGSAFLFLLLTAAGVFPVMISMKQSGFYILTVFPFFSIALGLFVLPLLEKLLQLSIKESWVKIFRLVTISLLLISIGFTVSRIHKTGRDRNKISDAYKIIAQTGKDQSINICPGLTRDWSLHAYYARYGHISLISEPGKTYKYYLTHDDCDRPDTVRSYHEIPLKLEEYRLFERK